MQKTKRPKNYYLAAAVMVGYIIGVGMFGLPFLVSRAGLLSFIILIAVLGLVQYLLHLIYANLIVVTEGYHRMPGYAEIYLGRRGKIIVFIAKLVGNCGALLAYIIITGIFLNQLLEPRFGGNEFIYASILFFCRSHYSVFRHQDDCQNRACYVRLADFSRSFNRRERIRGG